ncbi:uncharacterized protein CANTADRAFT_25155 [Suhomyces tanzawaensis NRRL Y-17324]|uniref:Carbohydrate kinase PfkB domain-containing protein n=1 Tax=Suhomyces tanzawaensis NRRL Y-17324 TaxID=984487 RepID=A0A1E4SMU2_9ASCO|nr:uncharacterized protein CANTADRAFT_25155 [Suhomyces tanzawaensis NRRL Y-17324]ODV80737.1 hypothetical protein CANTADRAFT_25155 [Suhomyces tanzawaensis NRRL Y-17324]
MAQDVEKVIRDNGAIPATCAFIDGVPYVGLQPEQLAMLAEVSTQGHINKVSRRDIGYTMANKLNGGTTIALTMILSHMAGIQVFSTGGLGGVHKEAHLTFDVSADLTELGRTPVTVVCSGPKAILDIGLTMEFLETQGVFVGTYNDNGRPNVEVPGFYCRESGVKSAYSFDSFDQVAGIVHNHNNVMGLTSGSVICVPPPEDIALSSSFINGIIDGALKEAKLVGVSGKEVTPFLLSKIAKDTHGKSVECNIKFVLNNAKAAAKIAKGLLECDVQGTPVMSTHVLPPALGQLDASVPGQAATSRAADAAHTVVVGSIALDTISTVGAKTKMGDSNPGSVESSVGGVGYNISLACHYASMAALESSSCRLVSMVGDDFSGKSIVSLLDSQNIDSSGIKVAPGQSTAQYSSTHSSDGELIVACADMAIIEQDFAAHIIEQLDRANPQNVVMDCNLAPAVANKVLHHIYKNHNHANVIIEPTSHAKASRISQLNTGVFPNNVLHLATPTAAEVESMYAGFSEQGKFDDFDQWFPLLDALGIDGTFREKLNALSNKKDHHVLKSLLSQGTLQQAFQLLPFVPNLYVKLGANGLLTLSISTNVNDYKSIPTTSLYRPTFMLKSEGRVLEGGSTMGVIIQHFPIPAENQNLAIKNVTGAGDSMLGFLVSRLLGRDDANWLQPELQSVEQEWGKWEALYKAQLASGLSLESSTAISEEIRFLK